ncbi:hypothetical protein [[Mycoplasma] mobile]|uniref:DUF3899 domain-containing protein n=1 Tax=Mycoplasma mobile (strain ATCC 43663 / 163K / NCTC 11711) TaxID=267748 RepID=Q6KHJ7_MYCM1|nr:hypothetical protein [[Mycoplasma] mobile]AAT27933.1 hypothetical protein MMOB4470 [Mycoplasma mobile 163K]
MKKYWKQNLNWKNLLLIISNLILTFIIMVLSVYLGNNKTWENGLFLASLIMICSTILYVIFTRTIFIENFRLNLFNRKNQRKIEKNLYLPEEKKSLEKIDIIQFRKVSNNKTWFNIIIISLIQITFLIISLVILNK